MTDTDPDLAVAALDDDENPDQCCGDYLALDPADDDVEDTELDTELDTEAAPGEPLPPLPASAYPPDAVELDVVRPVLTPEDGLEDEAPEVTPEAEEAPSA